jgi:hypothetical protein
MIDYIAYIEVQKKMRDQFSFQAAPLAEKTAIRSAQGHQHSPRTQVRHGLAEALRAAASRLDPVAA